MTIKGKVLVIAGSDPSGGAGLEADQKVLAAHGVYGMTATTALTAQNTTGVFGIHVTPADFLRQQIDTVVADIRPDVVKTGMLASAITIRTVAQAVKDHSFDRLVLDPVMVSTSGSRLLDEDAIAELRVLVSLSEVITPNEPEARLLLKELGDDQGKRIASKEVESVDDLQALAVSLLRLGPKAVLVKGGHCPFTGERKRAKTEAEKELMVDILVSRSAQDIETTFIESPYQNRRDTHGTGCSLASAIAANLAQGLPISEATRDACNYVEAGIRLAPGLGKGSGPLNHFHSLRALPFSPGRFVPYLLSRPDVAPVWEKFVYHPFVMALGNGTLPLESFKSYLVQDYLYLVHFARANALASYKAKNMNDVAACAAIVTHISHEMRLHLDYCAEFGISKERIESTEEKKECVAYTRYVLDIGQSEDWLALQVALAPCLLGYGAVAQMLVGHRDTRREDNIYLKWIENYVADDYMQAVQAGSDLLERHAQLQAPTRIEELAKIFVQATRMEIGFWEMFPSR